MADARGIVHSDPDIMGGAPVFQGTRVPLRILIDYVENGHTLDDFLDAFPTVTREQASAALAATDRGVSDRAHPDR